jgi:hypothetical protein
VVPCTWSARPSVDCREMYATCRSMCRETDALLPKQLAVPIKGQVTSRRGRAGRRAIRLATRHVAPRCGPRVGGRS